MGFPYALILLIAALILGIRYIVATEASGRSKILIATLIVLSVILFLRFPQLIVLALIIQAGVSVYALVYFKLHPD